MSTGAALDLGSEIAARGSAIAADAGDRAVLVVFASRGVEVLAAPPGAPRASLGAAERLRRGGTSDFPQPGAGLLPGLAVGDTRAVGPELDAAMKASSLTHLTAVSGANCAIVVGFAFAAAAACGARRGVRVAVAVAALAGFVALVTPEPSVIRAGAMAGHRDARRAARPHRRRAGGALRRRHRAAGRRPVARRLARLQPLRRRDGGAARARATARARHGTVDAARAGTCGRGAAGRPARVRPAHRARLPTVPLYGVLANIVAGPAAPVATIVGSAGLPGGAPPVAAGGLAALAWLPAAWIAATAHTVAALPSALLPWLEGWPGVAAARRARSGAWRRHPGVEGGPGGWMPRSAAFAAAGVAAAIGVVSGGVALSRGGGAADRPLRLVPRRLRRRAGRCGPAALTGRHRARRHRTRSRPADARAWPGSAFHASSCSC